MVIPFSVSGKFKLSNLFVGGERLDGTIYLLNVKIDEEVFRWNTNEADVWVRFAYMFGICPSTLYYKMVKCVC